MYYIINLWGLKEILLISIKSPKKLFTFEKNCDMIYVYCIVSSFEE